MEMPAEARQVIERRGPSGGQQRVLETMVNCRAMSHIKGDVSCSAPVGVNMQEKQGP